MGIGLLRSLGSSLAD